MASCSKDQILKFGNHTECSWSGRYCGKQALVKLMDQLGIPLCTSYFAHEDQDHVKRAESKMEVVTRKRRQTAALRETRVEQQYIEQEGTTYQAGGF